MDVNVRALVRTRRPRQLTTPRTGRDGTTTTTTSTTSQQRTARARVKARPPCRGARKKTTRCAPSFARAGRKSGMTLRARLARNAASSADDDGGIISPTSSKNTNGQKRRMRLYSPRTHGSGTSGRRLRASSVGARTMRQRIGMRR